MPALLAFLALIAKESAIAWSIALVLVDLIQPSKDEDKVSANGLRAAIRGAWPLLFFGLVYLFLRWQVFGTLGLGTKYSGEGIDNFFANKTRAYILESLAFYFAPVSTMLSGNGLAYYVMKAAQLVGNLGMFALGALALARCGRRRTAIMAVLMLIPMATAFPVSRLGDDFVNTRSLYTPLLALAAINALVLQKRPRIGRVLIFCCSPAFCQQLGNSKRPG